ncbi:predicted protein [Nematostella vectensis]|uniref:EF-hand domain-containing protein n=1 Tax=Nematostella vectensis TaxID=45351 RepID=A7RW01_NEMVE|nr:predicted protein [Nematostella vectensis]|eukprot:XP_001636390.1 predicted protein [Nematostella vectensis]
MSRATKDGTSTKSEEITENGDENQNEKKPEAKLSMAPGVKLVSRLTMHDLKAIQDAFTINQSGQQRELSLDVDQFCEILSIVLNKGVREEYEELFNKIDVAKEGFVDWDKFSSHMLLEYYEKDDRMKTTQVPQWRELRNISSPHKEVIRRISPLINPSRYLSVSKEGILCLWSLGMKQLRTVQVQPDQDEVKQRDLWVTDFIPMQNLYKLAIALTSKEIAIYDLSSKSEFNCQFRIKNLDDTPLCLDYCNPDKPNEAILAFGDVSGQVNALLFSAVNIALFDRPAQPAGSKQVMYSAHLDCFISCSTSYKGSLVLGWIEKTKSNMRTTAFKIPQGVNAFDYNEKANLVATAGVNHHVCLWNPYVISKPVGVLRGHMQSVVAVHFIESRGQLISLSKDKVLRIWDTHLQVCLQRLSGMFPKGPAEVSITMFYDEEHSKLFTAFNQQLTLMVMKPEVKDRVMSHEQPVTAAIYNSKFNQVVTACAGSVITMWMIDTGQKVKQFANAHGNAEITTITQDATETRLFTASADGTVKIWDFNGHCHSILMAGNGDPAEISQEHQDDILSVAYSPPTTIASASYDGEIVIWNMNSEQASRHLVAEKRRKPPRSSRRNRLRADSDIGSAVTKLIFLNSRPLPTSSPGANLVSCCGSGIVRFWNSQKHAFLAEFLAHQHAGSLTMAVDGTNSYLVTGDADGLIKVWDISEYCVEEPDNTITQPPPLLKQFQPHTDIINHIGLLTRNERLLVLTASSDCSAALWDIEGRQIGVFGQEEHWKIEPISEEERKAEQQRLEEEEESEEELEQNQDAEETGQADYFNNEDFDPEYRMSTWDRTILGKAYMETRSEKRERRQPMSIPDLPYLNWEKTGQAPAGPYAALETAELADVGTISKPDFVSHPEKYFSERQSAGKRSKALPPLPSITERLQMRYDDKSLFPKSILEMEAKMKAAHALGLRASRAASKRTDGQPSRAGNHGARKYTMSWNKVLMKRGSQGVTKDE